MTSLRNDVITSRRPFWVESMVLYFLHVWCEFRDNVARNTDTVFKNRDFWPKIAIMTSLRHDVITSRRFYGCLFYPRLQSMFGVSLETIEPETRMWWSKFQKKSKFQKSFRKYLENGWTDFQSGNRVGKVLMCTTSLPPVRFLIRVEIKELRAKKGEKITILSGHFDFATL